MHGNWPESVKTAPVVMSVGLYFSSGMNRSDRRAKRTRSDKKSGYTMPSSNIPAVKEIDENGKAQYV